MATALAGPVAYTLQTVNTPKGGSIITAGPTVRGGMGGPGGRFPGGGRPGMWRGTGQAQGMGGARGNPQGTGPGGFGERGAGRTGGMGAMGGLLNGSKVSAKAKALVEKDADHYTWAARRSARRTPRAINSPPRSR